MQVDTNIPLPSKINLRADLDKLEVGQSFAFENIKRNTVANAISGYFHKVSNKRFTISADPENPDSKSRVWRIEDAEVNQISA